MEDSEALVTTTSLDFGHLDPAGVGMQNKGQTSHFFQCASERSNIILESISMMAGGLKHLMIQGTYMLKLGAGFYHAGVTKTKIVLQPVHACVS